MCRLLWAIPQTKQIIIEKKKTFFLTMFNILQFIFATTTLFWVSGIPIEVDGKTIYFQIDLYSLLWFFDLRLFEVKYPDDLV